MDSCYDREEFPTLEQAIDWVWASSKEEKEAVEFVLGRFFELTNGVYTQKRIEGELERYHKTAEINKRIAREREAKRKDKGTKRDESVDEGYTVAQHTVDEPPPNHKPLTTNQEPSIKDIGDESPDSVKTEHHPKEKQKPKRFIKPTTEEIFSYMQERDFNFKDESDKFFDYYESNGWSVGKNKMKCWKSAIRTWINNYKKYNQAKPGKQQSYFADPNKFDYHKGVDENGRF